MTPDDPSNERLDDQPTQPTDLPDLPVNGHAAAGPPAHQPVDLPLRAVVRELERHAAEAGWDRPARLFALVPTADLLAQEPGLAGLVGVDPDADLTGSLTPVEQEDLPADQPVEAVLGQVVWPDEVFGTAVVVERLVLPPSVGELPDDPSSAQEIAESHPDRQEVRMVAAATRAGSTYCALRLRSHDDAFAVIEGPDVVPALLELLLSTLEASDTTEQ
ncbi:MAG: FIG129854: hypothetical protein [uncultured Nocardioidaceae bacterium]|uniref:Uncharacterized protein n=1 Tax=uncultured Nocardioidaceae bacterium TaxID=253824 RepID=A0A6J4L445_9ACTN|nr:MAG: FIG129854: hypothetical protein [uncultured Nocardioidaceae bacterium]